MAIGWGKSYEEQMEEASQRLSKPERGRRLTLAEKDRLQRLESLNLSKSRTLELLDRSRHPVHRAGLLKGLQEIEREIEELSE